MLNSSRFKAMALAISVGSVSLVGAAHAQMTEKGSGMLEKIHNEWRASKLDSAAVYNDANDKIGSIDDLLLDEHGQVTNAVISVGGFLGMGSKYIEVPFSKLQFKPSTENSGMMSSSNTTNGTPKDYSVVLPHSTKDSLKEMKAFDYNN